MSSEKLLRDLVSCICQLGSEYRSKKRDSDFLNLFLSSSQMIIEFSDVALVNYYLMKLVHSDRVEELVNIEHLNILNNSDFGKRFISFLNFYKIVIEHSKLVAPFNSYQNFDSMLNLIRLAVERSDGFSFIRIGDSEGGFNAREFLKRNYVADLPFSHYEDEVLLRQVGSKDSSDELRQKIYSDLTVAISQADCCGGFTYDDEIRCFELNKYSSELNFYEAYIGFLLTRLLLRQGRVDTIYMTANANILFSIENLRSIISEVNLIPVFIGPVNVSHVLLSDGAEFIQVPPRHLDLNIYGCDNDFPPLLFFYNNFIEDNINILNCCERIFFVSAGMSGKIICNAIKLNGGFAIDIGSATDYLAGYVSRSLNNF